MNDLFQLGMTEPLGIALAAVPAALNLALLVYVLARLPADRLTRTFVFFVSMLVAWQLFDLTVRAAITEEAAAAWRGLLRIWQFLAIAAGFHLALMMAELDRLASHPAVVALLYAPCILFESCYSAGIVVEHLEHVPVFGWISDSTELGPAFAVMTTWFSAQAVGLAVVLAWNVWRTRGQGDAHAAARVYLVGIAVPVVVGVVTEAVLPQLLGMRQVPVTSTTLSVFTLSTAFGLGRYELFRVNTLAAARAVLETLSDSLFVVRADGRVRYANRHATTTFGPLVRASFLDLLEGASSGAAFLSGPWARALAGESVTGVEVQVRTPASAPIVGLLSMTRLDLGGSGLGSVVVLVHDVGPMKRVEAELAAARDAAEAANRAKSLFLATTSHELRTPLNAIIGYSQMLSESAADEGDRQRVSDLGRIETSGRMLLHIIDDVLDLSRVESGKLEVSCGVFDSRELFDEVAPMAMELCRKNRNDFCVELADTGRVFADRQRLRQVLLNLLSNAAKFTTDGRITLRARTDHGQQYLDVEDTGIGMDQGQQARLFELFAQVHQDRARFGGTGIGLALSRRLCHLMDGELTLTSAPDVGSVFTVRIPLAPGDGVAP